MLTEWDILGNILRFSKRMSGKTKLAFLKPVNLFLVIIIPHNYCNCSVVMLTQLLD